MLKNRVLPLVLVAALALSFAACSKKEPENTSGSEIELVTEIVTEATADETVAEEVSEAESQAEEAENENEQAEPSKKITKHTELPTLQRTFEIGTLDDAAAIGLAQLMKKNDEETSFEIYDFEIEKSPSKLVSMISNGEIDMACIPANQAAVLYNSDDVDVQVVAINSIGGVQIMENGNAIRSLSDLNGKTVYAMEGTVADYVTKEVLSKNGVECSFKYVESAEKIAENMTAGNICVISEPYASTLYENNKSIQAVVNISDEWKKLGYEDYPMGVVVVNKAFFEDQRNAAAMEYFMDDYENSMLFVNESEKKTAEYAEEFGIVASAEIAKKVIPESGIAFFYGDEMQDKLDSFYEKLYEIDPASIGGEIPGKDFYYKLP